MDVSVTTWGLVGAVFALVVIGIAIVLKQRDRRRGETPVVALVRRRRELMSQLQQLAGEDSAELMRHEARRLHAGTNTVEVLQAAVERAERMTARGELEAGKAVRK